jgi:ubiquinone/menaquinone biosynthesis C-methylase UbiE
LKIANPCGSNGRRAVALALLGAEVTVFDISEENKKYALELANCSQVELNYIVGDLYDVDMKSYENYFDMLYLEGGILHYFHDIDKLMETLFTMLKPNGKIVLNDFHPFRKVMIINYFKSTIGDYFDDGIHQGDVAYKESMLFDPAYWREYFKPWVKAMIDECHKNKLPVIYHGCGNVNAIFGDFADIGLDAYNPLEVKADMDVLRLKKQYGNRIGYCGNNDILVWETNDPELIRKETLKKLNAAKGGGFIFQSDHSVSSSVKGKTYDFIVNLVREYGKYPLNLGEFDIKI